MLNSNHYYSTFHGHKIEYLKHIYKILKIHSPNSAVIYLAGDSSLDNKYWFDKTYKSINGYEKVLDVMKADINYFINKELYDRKISAFCMNTAVEATTLQDRINNLLEQDEFIKDNITEKDYLIVSIGGNDIALSPLFCTMINMACLTFCTPQYFINNCSCACVPNIDADCGCCGLSSCLLGLCSFPIGLGYMIDLFRNKVRAYVERLITYRKPKKVIISMIYYPDEIAGNSWADHTLNILGYNRNPSRLQDIIRRIFTLATQNIYIEGTEVLPLPLYTVLNGKNSKDYVERVEPSPQGSAKMAELFIDELFPDPRYSNACSSDE